MTIVSIVRSPSLFIGLMVGSLGIVWPITATAESSTSWSQFHGPSGLGVSVAGGLPMQWTNEDYRWSFDLKGKDVGSPVIDRDTVYVLDSESTASGNDSDHAGRSMLTIDLVAIDLETGKPRWRRSHRLVDGRRHARNSPASTTPVVADGRVVIAYGDPEGVFVHAYSTDGDVLWSRELRPWSGDHGFGTSPMVFGTTLILFNSQQAEQLDEGQTAGVSRMMAMDVRTGEDLWSTPLKTTRPCYGVPAIYADDRDGALEIIAANTGNGLFGLDASSGKMKWSIPVFDKRCCTSPLVVRGLAGGDLAIASSGSGGGGNVLSAVRIPKSSDEAPVEYFRITKSAPYVPTSAVKDGLLFAVSDSGIASCFDLNDSGRSLWSQRLGGNFSASPIVVGDQLLLIALDGTAHVTDAKASRSPVSEFQLGGPAGATPAAGDGSLVLRVGSKLHCLPISPSP